MFFRSRRIEKIAAQIGNDLSVPTKHETRLFGHDRNGGNLEIFLVARGAKSGDVFGRYDDRHALLRFADGKLGAVKTFIFFRHGVKID